jgi:signal transduction histidine kinase
MPLGPLASLRNRVFLASALVAVLALVFALRFVTDRATRSAEAELRRGLQEAADLVGRTYASRLESLATTARLVADLPILKAAVATGDPLTVEPVARDYASRVRVRLLAIANRDGRVLAVVGPQAEAGVDPAAVAQALLGHETTGFRSGRQGVLHVVTVPMAFRTQAPEVVGTLSLGLALDASLARELRGVTESEVAFAAEGRVLASSLEGAVAEAVRPVLTAGAGAEVTVGGNEYVALARPLAGETQGPLFVVLRSRTERLRFLEPLRTALVAAAAAAVLGAVLLSFMVSRTVTRPLAEITTAMREIARTGDFSRKVPPGSTYYDEDARVLGSAFNTLLDSVVRFQREAAQKERLSALGRLSTVIAHEVRNPLMIIKASLRGLRRSGVKPAEVEEAAVDIDHEVARLNRIVGDVLDFARPLRLDLQPTDLNAVCRDAAAASLAGERPEPGAAERADRSAEPDDPSGPRRPVVRLDLAFANGQLLTDPERLRTALVNVLGNAREAVAERLRASAPGRATPGEADIELSTFPAPDGGATIVVHDLGVGIAPADLPHVFEPYFTTKRSGTGLGLAIARNIVEALRGTITVRSSPGEGTSIRIELPLRSSPGSEGGSA